jgi:hypothetical protein
MIPRITSIWIAVTGSALVSFFLFLTAYWFDNLYDQTQGGKPLPAISKHFYPPASAIYYFPLPLFCWALLITFRYRDSTDHCALFCIVTVVLTLVFIAAFAFFVSMPFLPMKIYRMHP